MKSFFQIINNSRLNCLSNCINDDLDAREISEQFKAIEKKFPKYDREFLWVLCYDHLSIVRNYIEKAYKTFHQVLDSGFPRKLAVKNGFESHMWELILCDVLSSYGILIPKSKAGSDFLLDTSDGQRIQIEAVAPNEADEESLRSSRPDYYESSVFPLVANIEDFERPVLLRFIKGFDDKADMKYDCNKPLIIAINTSKTVGLVSNDKCAIARILFGLGDFVITRKSDGSHKYGFKQKIILNKPGEKEFLVARFRDPKYKHVSGVIYTSQSPKELIPGGCGWSNYGITYVPNSLAINKVDIDFDVFRKIICNEKIYKEVDAQKDFVSCVL